MNPALDKEAALEHTMSRWRVTIDTPDGLHYTYDQPEGESEWAHAEAKSRFQKAHPGYNADNCDFHTIAVHRG